MNAKGVCQVVNDRCITWGGQVLNAVTVSHLLRQRCFLGCCADDFDQEVGDQSGGGIFIT